MDSPFMEEMAKRLAHHSIETLRFEFPYMIERRESGVKRPPDKLAKLCEFYLSVISNECAQSRLPIFIGGKSMGGRIAVMVADNSCANGVICLGYPFHPVGKPETLRTNVLLSLQKPALIVQGCRDKLGSKTEVETYKLKKSISICWLEDGDHDLKPRKKSGRTASEHMQAAAGYISTFVTEALRKE